LSQSVQKKASDVGQSVDMSVLERKLGYQVRMADRIMNREFAQIVGMTPVQYSVYSLVATNEGLSQVAIGEALHMDRASTMAIVDKLQAAKLIERRRSLVDKRMQALHLTDLGKKEFVAVDKRVEEHDQKFLSRLTKTQAKGLLETIESLRGFRR